MKRLLLSGLALSGPLYFNAAAETPYDSVCEPNWVKGVDCAPYESVCNPILIEDNNCTAKDEIVAVGERIGNVSKDVLTSPVSILSKTDIENRNQTYVSDLLRALPGLAVNRSGPGGSLTQLRMRGTEANHTLVLIDGVDASNPNTGEFDFAGLSSKNIAKIEVLRGEQSALYGSDAVGGVINIITRTGASARSFTASVEAGSQNSLTGQVSAIVPLGEAALSINGAAFATDGYDISGLGGEDDGAKRRNLNLGLNNMTLGGVTLSAMASGSHMKADFDSDVNFDGRLNNTNEELITDNQNARLDARFSIAGFENLVTASMARTETSNPLSSFRNDTTGKRTTLNWAVKKNWNDHSLTFLAETETEKFSNFGGINAGQNQTESIRNEAIAADYKFHNGALTLTGSARQDFNDRFDDAFTWRAGAGYGFGWNGRLRGSVGTGIKNPSMTELFGFFPGGFIGNPDVTPETSLGYNIGYEQSLLGERLKLSIDYFRSELEDEIVTVFNPNFTSTVSNRLTDSTRQGVELETRWDISDKLGLRSSMSFLKAEENNIDEIRRPKFLASASATWRPIDALSLTGHIEHTGSQLDTDFATFSHVTLKAFTLAGLNAAYNLNDTMTLTVRGENLLDEDYQEVVGYESQGRGVYAGLRARFD